MTETHSFRIARTARALAAGAALLAVTSCGGDDFDSAQLPQINITPVLTLPLVFIAWQPEGAGLVRVYKGASPNPGDVAATVWSITATSDNSILSGIEYGATTLRGATTAVAAQPLVRGQAYTVEISRLDPKGKVGPTGNAYRYVSTQSFTLTLAPPPAQ
jgi:hypothetical protein